jgi:acyl-coenzyme A thioesterase PaaI-like protein
MAVSHRRWAQSYAGVELCVNFVNRLYLGDIRLRGELKHYAEND